MINQDFSEFPEHRVGFFKLLRAINASCFTGQLFYVRPSPIQRSSSTYLINTRTQFTTSALLALEPNRFKLMMDSVIWAIKHITRDIADTGLAFVFFPLSI
jgi:exportin-1